ncbi:hypothetical protein P280DRAFT_513623 [Massarina eburnea CBS 473.64]|uniref:F-box domain-containing protein n=1 Tax=Massarina eburnea CBS 473.64 TaxID=1395130 RepID=A0A6A6SEL2_9PLEO|nr:hypothetical protein P280DRAFT_513623 [Massarina eburnea CBS 473.64]
MPRHGNLPSDDDEPLEDRTAALQLHSKRTSRQDKKQKKRDRKRDAVVNLTKLPSELIIECLKPLSPGDVLCFGHVNRRFRTLVDAHATVIGDSIISQRYSILAQCFPLPKFLHEVEPSTRALLLDEKRQKGLGIHGKTYYQHVPKPDPHVLCSCLTCLMLWNNLCLALDFAHWQDSLDTGKAIAMIPRGQAPPWNEALVRRSAQMVKAAQHSSLWHARILEVHLDSTVRSIRRHAKNQGNKRKHVDMTDEDADGTDAFLCKPGPLSLEFPFHRDEYYLLEAYLPNRWWRKDVDTWIYTIAGQHERDLDLVVRYANRSWGDPQIRIQ